MDLENASVDDLKKYIKKLQRENSFLKDEVDAVQNSPFLPQTIAKLNYRVVLHRKIILENELRSRVNEKEGSLFEIKNQIRTILKLQIFRFCNNLN